MADLIYKLFCPGHGMKWLNNVKLHPTLSNMFDCAVQTC